MVNAVHERCTVIEEKHEDTGTRLHVRAAKSTLEKIRAELAN
jgi:hypothetical protein